MWNGKRKAVTFSYDDGVTQDIRLIGLLDKYGLKATFNLNSAYLGLPGRLERENTVVSHNKVHACKVKETYRNHEVAVHTLSHPNLTEQDAGTIVWQVEQDRKLLTGLVGYDVVGMAYPCGGVNNDDRVAEVIKTQTGVKYARTITSTYNFDLQTNLHRFNPSVYHVMEFDRLMELGKRFVALKTTAPQLFYIWGHSYEFDIADNWQRMEEFCRLISGQPDICYGTNRDVLLA